MKKLKIIIGLLIGTGYLLASSTGVSAYAGGNGTVNNPWQIATCADLATINSNASYLDDSYIVMNDLDCSSAGNTVIIGSSAQPFAGTFDGGKHMIRLNIDDLASTNVGLFSTTAGATIHDVIMAGIVKGSTNTGALVGSDNGGTTVSRIVGTANVASNNYNVGGLVGFLGAASTLSDSYFSAEVSSNGSILSGDQVGSVVGMAAGSNTIISHVYSTGRVHATGGSIGGVVGHLGSGALLSASFFAGIVDTVGSNLGLVVGYNYQSTTTDIYADRYISDMGWQVPSCVGVNAGTGTCNLVNANGSTPNYFKGNSTSAPFTQWDFATIWQVNAGGYPSLRGFNTAPPAITDFASTDPASDIYVTGVNLDPNAITFDGSAATVQSSSGTTQLVVNNQSSPSLVILTNNDNQLVAAVYQYNPANASLFPTLTFNTQGGSSVSSISNTLTGNSVTLPGAPMRSGYTFLNWNTATDGSGTAYSAGQSYTVLSGATTFYATWQSQTGSGGGVSSADQAGGGVLVDTGSDLIAPTLIAGVLITVALLIVSQPWQRLRKR